MQADDHNENPETEEQEEGELPAEQVDQTFQKQVDDEFCQVTSQESKLVTEANSAAIPAQKLLCRFFQKGICRYGLICRYSHDNGAPVSVPTYGLLPHPKSFTQCRFFVKGYCRYGEECKFAHQNGNINEQVIGSVDQEIDGNIYTINDTDDLNDTTQRDPLAQFLTPEHREDIRQASAHLHTQWGFPLGSDEVSEPYSPPEPKIWDGDAQIL
ncbi:hypothetical protein G9A89_011957 [Geosiphon pyriformis]|nr:hypothetical protein G9A89_011957 [Geosiphon pyriformis]